MNFSLQAIRFCGALIMRAGRARRGCTTVRVAYRGVPQGWLLTGPVALANDAGMRLRRTERALRSVLALLWLAGAVLVHAPLARADVLIGSVLRVIDGDTILLQSPDNLRQSVRIAGIDAPEPAQPYGREAREYLARLVSGGDVRAECPKLDHRTSVVCKVWARPTDCASCERSIDVGLAQISGGMAWWYRRYAMEQSAEDRARYEAEEKTARQNGRGLWAAKDPVAPWDWRRGR
jgi:endonuclease YncB( thermonuclease family)